MEKTEKRIRGKRESDLIKSFNLAISSILTCCSNQDFCNAFSQFSISDQQSLRRLYIQVITSLHKTILDEFESLCREMQVGEVLDSVEQLVEEQNLDPLFLQKTNVMDVVQNLSMAKKNEIQNLTVLLERAEEHNALAQSRLELLKKEVQDVPIRMDVIEKMRNGVANYGHAILERKEL